MIEIIGLELKIETERLLSRRCLRCGADDFRAVVFEAHEQCSELDSNVKPYGGEHSQTSIPLAICLKCKRLVTLI